jgi:hypothetical protein
MSIGDSVLYNKVFGCVVGGAIGDAFGIRLEMMHYRDIETQYGRVTHFDRLPPRQPSVEPLLERYYPFGPPMENEGGFHPLGRWIKEIGGYTDDTRYQLIAYQAILRQRGPIDGADLAEEWLNYRLMAEGATEHASTWSWPGPERTYARHLASLSRLVRMATQQRPLTPGWDGPLGLIHAGDPAAAAKVGSPFAVAVAAAMQPGASIDDVIATTLRHPGAAGAHAGEFIGRMNRLREIAATCEDVFDLREPFYREFLVTFPPWELVFALEMVPCALALSLIARGDPAQAIIGAANLGRDADTIAGMAGGLSGALAGARAFPVEWVDKVVRANPEPDLPQLAADLCQVLVEQAEERQSGTQAILTLT